MFSIARLTALAALTVAAAACAPEAPTLPFAASHNFSVPSVAPVAISNANVADTIRLEIGRTSQIEVGGRQYQRFVRYSSSNNYVASVSSSGVITALSPGSSTVTGSFGDISEQVEVIVADVPPDVPTVVSFGISPKYGASLNAGESRTFTVTALWSDNAPRYAGVTYSATGGTVSPMGVFTAGHTAGLFMVVASCVCGLADTAYVSVGDVPVQLATLTISPKSVTLEPGATYQFTSSVTWSTGDTTSPPRSYSASGGQIVAATGAYIAPVALGSYRVIVEHVGGTLKDTAYVTVASTASNPETPPPPPTQPPTTEPPNTTPPTTPPPTTPPTSPPPTEPPPPPYTGSFGPGPNAPNWAGKRTYPEELFTQPLPVHYAGANTAGFKGWQGFDGAWGAVYKPTRVAYPVVSTPIGLKRVLEVTYPGSSQNISAVNATSAVWPANQAWGVRVTGNWSGTLVFERSLDGIIWLPVSLQGSRAGSGTTSKSGSQTSENGVWISNDALTSALGQFRVRATSWSGGTATVAVGMQGGAAAARMSAGNFTGNPTRIYTRVMVFIDPNWSNGANAGTKFFFFSQQQGNNHYTGLFGEQGVAAFVGLQQTASRNIPGLSKAANGSWVDVEFLFIANTPGVSNGVARAWINGVESLNANDVLYFASGKVAGFSTLWMDPTYGGGAAPPPSNVFFRIAGWYRESAP